MSISGSSDQHACVLSIVASRMCMLLYTVFCIKHRVYGSTDFTSEHLIAGLGSQVNKRALKSTVHTDLWEDGIIPYSLSIEDPCKS